MVGECDNNPKRNNPNRPDATALKRRWGTRPSFMLPAPASPSAASDTLRNCVAWYAGNNDSAALGCQARLQHGSLLEGVSNINFEVRRSAEGGGNTLTAQCKGDSSECKLLFDVKSDMKRCECMLMK